MSNYHKETTDSVLQADNIILINDICMIDSPSPPTDQQESKQNSKLLKSLITSNTLRQNEMESKEDRSNRQVNGEQK